jgi:sterol desaturase/sphingolipid hydroxylase (fatty acid hydroxylase superfamily)
MSALLGLVVSAGLLAVVFVPLERLWKAREQPVLRERWLTDLAFLAGQSLVWSAVVGSAVLLLAAPLQWSALDGLRATWARQPWALQALEVLLLGDLVVYWAHRASHRVPLLWRFHRVHHTAEHLDWLAAYREHPVDGIYTQLLLNAPALLLGFPLGTIAGMAVFRGMWGVFIHSNVRMPLGPLKYLVGAPSLHHWHHDRHSGGDCNYANLMPLMDVLFGTYREPPHEPPSYGVNERTAKSYLGLLLEAFTPQARRQRE